MGVNGITPHDSGRIKGFGASRTPPAGVIGLSWVA